MDHYQYQPLPSPTSIRLIRLSPGAKSGDFSCSFVTADISNPPKYNALSYVWGKSSSTVPIICDGKIVDVTPNLQDALRSFRDTDTHLWADALCINQKDVAERNQQVNMMSKIYSKASSVTVWLGNDDHNDAPVIFENFEALVESLATINTAGGQFRHFDAESGDLHWIDGDGQDCALPLPKAIVDPDEGEKARLRRFFKLPWFSRIWVLQEIGLASDPEVLWGGNTMKWHPIGLTAMFLLRHCRSLLDKLALATDVENVYHLYTTFSPFTPWVTSLHVIHNSRRFKATDPRDKVFALISHPIAHTISITTDTLNWAGFEPYLKLAINFLPSHDDKWAVKTLAERRAKSYSPPGELHPPLIRADYSKMVEEVYRDFALDHINRTESLEVLTTVQHDPEHTSDLPTPSWVPRWDHFTDTPVLGFYNSSHIASGNKSAIVTPSPTDAQNSLIIRGTLITRIVDHTDLLESSSFDLPLPSTPPAVGSSSPLVQQLWETNPLAKLWLSNLADADPQSYPQLPLLFTGNGLAIFDRAASSVYDAYVRTWVAGKPMSEVDGFDFALDSAAYCERLFWGTEGNPANALRELLGAATLDERGARDEEDRVRWKRYRDSAARVCHKRRFFMTKKGFFGLGPGALRPGDFVAVLLGGDVPFVIREVPVVDDDGSEEVRREANRPVAMDAKFQLVGECYVDGLMQGQAVKGLEIKRNITLV